jgi:hypothetical protein
MAVALVLGGLYAAGRTHFPVLGILVMLAGMVYGAVSVSGDRSEGIRGAALVVLLAVIAILLLSFLL